MATSKDKKAISPEEISLSNGNEDGSLGQIKINHSVVASIVRLAALEVEGVYAVGGGFVDGIAEIFSKKESDRGVRVIENQNGAYEIDVRVVLKFGVELAKVALNIQENVTRQIQHMTMKDVYKANIIIDGIKMVQSHKHEEDEHHHQAQTD